MSDALQLNYSIENEVVRNATKNFAGMLEKAFEQYKKLWNEYLKLWKHCENANVKIPFEFPESGNYENKNVTKSHNKRKSQGSSENTRTPSSVYESVYNVSDSDTSDDTVLRYSKPMNNQMNDDLMKSPILAMKRSRLKKINISRSYCFSEDSEESSLTKEAASVLTKSHDLIKVPVKLEENECSFLENNNDEIECTPISKVPRKLAISNLYNVDTTLLPNGKKLRQSKLVFCQSEKTADNDVHRKQKELKTLRQHMSPTPERNVIEKSEKACRIKSVDEEIIEGSPNKQKESNLRIKSLKLKKRSPAKLTAKSIRRKSKVHDDSKQYLKQISGFSLSQYLPLVSTSIQIDEPCSIKKSKTFSSSHNDNSGSDNDMLSSPFSPILADIDDSRFEINKELSSPVKEPKGLENTENESQAQKRKFGESTGQEPNHNCLSYNDETFFLLGEKFKQEPACNTDKLIDTEENMNEDNILSASPPAKKSLMSSFDMPPEKKNISIHKPSKSKSERAKMTGVTCWECKQYYANLGLSEKEIQARQNQCSRHRTNNKKERESTPEGFWNPLFPDTFTSTFQDN